MKRQNIYRNRVAIITGGASGIGAALATHLASADARVVIADRQAELAESLAAAIRTSGKTAVAMELDVRDPMAMTRVVTDTVARFHAVDFFFNNAGIGVGGEVSDYTMRDWDDVLDVNLRGVTHGVQAVYPVMLRQGWGHIVNTASVAGLIGTPGLVAYCASKHAVVGLSKALRVEAKAYGVRVSVLCPGAVRTPILHAGKYGRINMQGATYEKLAELSEQLRPIDPELFAQRAAAAVARNEAIIVVPGWWKLLWYLDRISPAWSLKLMESGFERMRAQLKAAGIRPSTPSSDALPVDGTHSIL